jgi:uncharacterized protein YndB with AHSA1/START domain
MATIAHQVWINAEPAEIYKAVTLTEGLSKWWLKECQARPEVGFVNEFYMNGHVHDRMLIVALHPNEYVEWKCVNDNGMWTGTHLSFAIKDKNGITVLDFKHTNWEAETEFFTICNFHWARHLLMLKALCETGEDQINPQVEANWMETAGKVFY